MAHVGGIAAISALLAYLTWRVAYTLPVGGWTSPSPGCW
jgi:cellulose synthase (UDP-forming)